MSALLMCSIADIIKQMQLEQHFQEQLPVGESGPLFIQELSDYLEHTGTRDPFMDVSTKKVKMDLKIDSTERGQKICLSIWVSCRREWE